MIGALTVTRVMFWHTLDGIYLQVFRHFPLAHVARLNRPSQLGVLHYTRLRMEGHSGPYPLPVDDMGPW
jgi:hypothetical protein